MPPPAGTSYDVFNGDADGLCALHQLRLSRPPAGRLVTGVKRDVALLAGLSHLQGARLTVLDVSLEVNRAQLQSLLAQGCRVLYFDHHHAGTIPDHPSLEAHIDTAPNVCTSLLVDRYLAGAQRAWAVAAAYGDNLAGPAEAAAATLGLDAAARAELRELGELLNYNGYGETVDDLHFHPADLFRAMQPYTDPRVFFREAPQAEVLRAGFAADLAQAEAAEVLADSATGRVVRLPAEAWARRVMGTFANRLANERPSGGTALVVPNGDGTLRVSVRAPLARPAGADDLCRGFPGGGGRAGAAGINNLPTSELPRFLEAFQAAFPSVSG